MSNSKPDDENTHNVEEPKTDRTRSFADKISTVGWSLFFIWIGIALLMKLDVGIGLLGVGIITLLVQMTRKYLDLKIEGFWIVVGLLFVAGGFWETFKPSVPLVPVLLIIVGVALLISVVGRLI